MQVPPRLGELGVSLPQPHCDLTHGCSLVNSTTSTSCFWKYLWFKDGGGQAALILCPDQSSLGWHNVHSTD